MQVTNTQRVNSVLDWLRRPADIRPEFVTLYFDTIDSAGHDGGLAVQFTHDYRPMDAELCPVAFSETRTGLSNAGGGIYALD